MNKSSKIWSRFSFLFCKSYCDTSARGCIVRIRITPDQKSDWLAAKFFSIPMFWLGKIYQFFNHHLICYQELLIFHVQFIKMVANFLPIFQFAKKISMPKFGQEIIIQNTQYMDTLPFQNFWIGLHQYSSSALRTRHDGAQVGVGVCLVPRFGILKGIFYTFEVLNID